MKAEEVRRSRERVILWCWGWGWGLLAGKGGVCGREKEKRGSEREGEREEVLPDGMT